MLAFKHDAGGFGTLGTLALEAETSGGSNITAYRYRSNGHSFRGGFDGDTAPSLDSEGGPRPKRHENPQNLPRRPPSRSPVPGHPWNRRRLPSAYRGGDECSADSRGGRRGTGDSTLHSRRFHNRRGDDRRGVVKPSSRIGLPGRGQTLRKP